MDTRSGKKRWFAAALILLMLLGAGMNWSPVPVNPQSSTVLVRTETVPAVLVQTSADAEPKLDAFTAFEQWIDTVYSNTDLNTLNPEVLATGVKLAQERRVAMKELIESDPQSAQIVALPERVKASLPEAVRAQVETRVSARGSLSALVSTPIDTNQKPIVRRMANMNGRDYRAYVYGRRLQQGQVENAYLNGIVLDSSVAIDENPVRPINMADVNLDEVIAAAAEAECPISLENALSKGDLALAQVGGRTVYLCSQGHIHALNDELIAQEGSGGSGGIAQSAYTEGQKSVLFIRVDFSDLPGEPVSQSAAQTLIDTTASNFFQTNSYGVTTLTGTVTALLRMPQTSNYYKTTTNGDIQLLSDARTAATNAGFTLSNFNLDIVAHQYIFNGWAGQGYVGAKGTWLNGYFDLRVTCHELAHNFGLWHANYWQTSDGSTLGTGSNLEYGDVFDNLGASNANSANHHYNVYEKNTLNWLPSSYVNTISASGTYRVFTHDQAVLNAANKYALKLTRGDGRTYWMEMRQALTGNTWSMNGIGLRWGAWANSNGGSHLLDTTPGSANGRDDSPILIGRTFSDVSNGIHITPLKKNGTTPESIDVAVNIGAFASNSAPTVTLAASSQFPAVGEEVTITATASDPNGDTLAYIWTHTDTFISDNSATHKRTFSSAGTKTVTCTVSDMKGKTVSAQIQINVSATPANQTLTIANISNASESGGAGLLRVTRTGTTTGALTATYQIGGTATASSDYTALSGSVSFGANVTTADITVTPVADTLFESNETVTVTLVAAATHNIGTSGNASVTIQDDETAQITSGIVITPTEPLATQSISFVCSSNIAGATYSWNFGDGTQESAPATTAHTFTNPGVYAVTVTATHPGSGTTATASLSVNVKPMPLRLPVTKLSGSARFDKFDADVISMTFNVPDIKFGYVPLGQSISVVAGGAGDSFTLGKSGSGKSGKSSASLKVARKAGQMTTLTISLKGSLSQRWNASGVEMNRTAKNARETIAIKVTVGGKTYEMDQSVSFTATAGKKASFKK